MRSRSGGGMGIQHVGGSYEQHFRQIEGYGEVVVSERVVLLEIQHLEQGRKRIALMAGREFVDFVEHEDRVSAAGFAYGLRYVAGQ